MNIEPLTKFRSVNSSSTGFPSRVDVLAFPGDANDPIGDAGTAAGRCVLDLSVNRGPNGTACKWLELWPYGLGSDDDAFSIRVIGWMRIAPVLSDGRFQWRPTILSEFAVVCCTDVGVAGGRVLNTERYVDAITIVTEPPRTADVTRIGDCRITAPGANLAAHLRMNVEGVERIELTFDQTTGTPTMNALYRFLDN